MTEKKKKIGRKKKSEGQDIDSKETPGKMGKMGFTWNMMNALDINQEFISRGFESNKISALKFENKKFQTRKMIIFDPVVKDGLTGSFEVCYLIKRTE